MLQYLSLLFQKLKTKISKFTKYTCADAQAKKNCAYFIQLMEIYNSYKNSLIADGQDEDEINEQMLIAAKHMQTKANLYMYQTFTRELIIDTCQKQVQDYKFVHALQISIDNSLSYDYDQLISQYLSEFGKIEDISKYILKYTIAGNFKLVDILAKLK